MTKLSLCMIAKNEEDCIAESLSSVKELADEMIVVDTGSTDRTAEIAKKCGARVFDFAWKNDFSAARNFAISKASGDWILVLDADEVIAKGDHEKIRELLKSGKADAFVPVIRTYTRERRLNDWFPADDYAECKSYTGYYVERPLRLFRNKKEHRFEGKVHESVIPSIEKTGGIIKQIEIPIHHYGEVRSDKKMSEKKKRYIAICEMELEKNPEDMKTRYELSLALIQEDKYEEARKHLEKIKDPKYKNTLLFLAETYTREGKLDEAIKTYSQAIAYNPQNPTPWANIGFLYRVQNKLDEARRYLKKALELNPQNPAIYDQLGEILVLQGEPEKAKQLLELALKRQKNPVHLNNLACIYLGEGRKEDARRLWEEAEAMLKNAPKELLEKDTLLKQTLEKVKKNLEKIKT